MYDEYDELDISLQIPLKELNLAETTTCSWSESYRNAVELINAPREQEQTFLPTSTPFGQCPSSKSSKSFIIFTNQPINKLDCSDVTANESETVLSDVTTSQNSNSELSKLENNSTNASTSAS